MDSNNAILFTFGLIFLLLGIFSPIINDEFNNDVPVMDSDTIDEIGQNDITSSTAVQTLGGVFFWVFGVPFWLNIIISMMRVIFWIIVYDKIRGI